MQEYKIHNAEVLFREDCDADDLIDVIEGNRRYIKCLSVPPRRTHSSRSRKYPQQLLQKCTASAWLTMLTLAWR